MHIRTLGGAHLRAFVATVLLFAAASTLFLVSRSALASAGDLDATFGGTGVVNVGPVVESPFHWATPYKHNAIVTAVHSGAAGARTTRVYRFNEDGTPDATFGAGGSTLLSGTLDNATIDIVSDKRDRVLVAVASDTRLRVYRLTATGAVDASFGTAGMAEVGIVDGFGIVRMFTQRDRKVLVATTELNAGTGTHDLALRRFNENGSIDSAFASGGVFRWQGPGPSTRTWGAGVGLQADGRIIVSGRYSPSGGAYTGYVLRLTTGGALDAAFGTSGGYTPIVWVAGNLNSARHLVVMGDDRIVTGGGTYDPATGTNGSAVLARLKPEGFFDTTFGAGTGQTTYPLPTFGGSWFHLGVASNDKIVLGGVKGESASDTNVASGNILRFRDNGVIDTGFAGDGSFEYAPTSPPLVGGAQAILDNDDRPTGVYSVLTALGATTAQPVLVRVEAGKKSCP